MTAYVPTLIEQALGWVFGVDPQVRLPRGPVPQPRAVLDELLLGAWDRPPVLVAFSGGVDSSAVLAAAVDLARREGLESPVPVSRVYPEAAETEEGEWQRLLLAHLGIRDWVRLEFRDELDLIGPVAAQVLRRHGPVWPAAAHASVPLLDQARGGTLLSGEGGDEVLGPRRLTPLDGIVRRRTRPTVSLAAASVRGLMPRPLVAHRARRAWRPPPWARPAAVEEGRRLTALDPEPLLMRPALEWLLARRAWCEGRRTRAALARERNVRHVDPLLDPLFVAAVAEHWTSADVGSRARALARLIPGLLPDAVRRRTQKARFNTALFGGHSRAFARGWEGDGIDERYVDGQRLRASWLEPEPSGRAALLLQQAWLSA